jgi:hypothetical protein
VSNFSSVEHIRLSYDCAEDTWKGNAGFAFDHSSDEDGGHFEFERDDSGNT